LDATDPAQPFIRFSSPLMALEHVSVIDATGARPKPDQTILIARGQIAAIGNAGSVPVSQDAHRIDLAGYSAIPGLVGMHDHLFYSANFFGSEGILAHDMPFSYPRLYLASGVTTIRNRLFRTLHRSRNQESHRCLEPCSAPK
jgi:predicted amidohydrolase